MPANRYPDSAFPDPASGLVDAERRAQFEEEGAHFESRYFLTFVWLPPAETPHAPRPGSMRAARARASDWREALAASSTAPTACSP